MYAGGANMYLEDGTYYMIGEGKKVLGQDLSACFNLYSTTDLSTWKNLGCALNNSAIIAPPPFDKSYPYRMERPKIFKCPGGDQSYRMWFHCDTSNFAMKSVGVLRSDSITGPYTFVAPCFKPDGQDSYDMGTFVDETGDGKAYLIRSVRNSFAGISQMNDACTNVTGIVSQGPDMEGQAIMRDSNGTLHAAGSHLTGWAANPAQFVATTSTTLVNAVWTNNYNPSGDSTTYNSQSTFIFPYVHPDGHKTFIWMADRWNDSGPGGLDNMTMIWLPMLPPTGPSPTQPAAGWFIELDNCDSSKPFQQFTINAQNQIVHSSGFCVSQPSGAAPGGTLQLSTCSPAGKNPLQTWYTYQNSNIYSKQSPSANGCMEWNNANQVLPVGNPVIAWNCDNAWNSRWQLPATGTAGTLQAFSQTGPLSGMCASVAPPGNPSQWTLPWYDQWSLKDF